MKGLSEKQTKELLARIREAKKNGVPLVSVFDEYAKDSGRAAGSIRNFYYRCVAERRADGLTAKTNEYFSESDENELIARFLRDRVRYGSIRRTAFAIANGDPVLALRYQNKFFNLLKKRREKILREMKELDDKGEKYIDPYDASSVLLKKARLEKKIDRLIAKITEKCASENAELKEKLQELEELKSGRTSGKSGKNAKSKMSDYFCGKTKSPAKKTGKRF